MPRIQTYDIYTMPAAGATKTYVATDIVDVYELNATGGAITLAADMIFTYSGTPDMACEFKFQYGGGVTQSTSSGWTVSFFGTSLTDDQALLPLVVIAYWNGATWEVNITKSINIEIANPTVITGTGASVTSTGTNPIIYTVNSNLTVANTIYISKSGVDATALPNRPDRPYLTIAAGRAAAVALTPTALARVRIVLENGTWTNEQVILYSYVDWDLASSLIYTTTNTVSITDNNVAVTDCTVYGKANILTVSSSAVASILRCVELLNTGSNVNFYCNNINITTTGSATLVDGIYSLGTLNLYLNNVTINSPTLSARGIAATTGGKIKGVVNDVSVTAITGNGVVSSEAGSLISLIANDISFIGASAAWTVSAQNDATFYLKCNNIYHTGAVTHASLNRNAAVCCAQDAPKFYVECNDIISTPSTNVTACAIKLGNLDSDPTTSGAILSIKCRETIITGVLGSTTNYPILMNDNTANAPILMISGRFKSSSASIVNCIQNIAGTLITQGAVLIPATTGDSVANSGLWKDYGTTVMTTAASGTAVTVGTPIVSALVL